MIIEKEFTASPGKKLSVELPGADVDITGWDRELVSVKTQFSGRDDEIGPFDFHENSTGVEICSRHIGSGPGRSPKDFKFEIRVPKKFDIEINLIAGRISINDVAGHIKGVSMAGDLNLRALKGALNLETMAGNISLLNSEVSGQVKTMAGQVVMQGVSGSVQGSSMTCEVVHRKSPQQLQKTSGEVRLFRMAGDIIVGHASAGADLTTLAGNIRVRSATGLVKAQTNAGTIVIDAVDGSVHAWTMAGGASVRMVGPADKGKRDVELTTMGEVTELIVPANLSMQVEIALAQTVDCVRDYRIVSDFEIQQNDSGTWVHDEGTARKYLYGTGSFAGGRNRIKIKTVNADVYLRKGA
jgi:hypothetical protein